MTIYRPDVESMDREALVRLQLNKLRRMVDYCLSSSSFYRQKLRDQYPAGLLAVPTKAGELFDY